VPTLATDPERVEETHEYRLLSSTGAGMVERRNAYPSGRKRRTEYTLSWDMASTDERDTLVLFVQSVNGGGSFLWTPPGGVQGTYRLLNAAMDVVFESSASHKLELIIEEV